MPQYTLPRAGRPGIQELLSESGAIAVQAMDDGPVAAEHAQWWRFRCGSGNARALLCIGEHPELPEHTIVTVCADLRRLTFPWRLLGDIRLVRRLARALEHAGASVLVES